MVSYSLKCEAHRTAHLYTIGAQAVLYVYLDCNGWQLIYKKARFRRWINRIALLIWYDYPRARFSYNKSALRDSRLSSRRWICTLWLPYYSGRIFWYRNLGTTSPNWRCFGPPYIRLGGLSLYSPPYSWPVRWRCGIRQADKICKQWCASEYLFSFLKSFCAGIGFTCSCLAATRIIQLKTEGLPVSGQLSTKPLASLASPNRSVICTELCWVEIRQCFQNEIHQTLHPRP